MRRLGIAADDRIETGASRPMICAGKTDGATLLQNRNNAITAVLILTCCLMLSLSGCGSGGGRGETDSPDAAAGRAAFSVRWPDSSRLIPFAANSIRVRLTRGDFL